MDTRHEGFNRPKQLQEILPALSMIVERAGYLKLEGGRLRVTLRRFKDQRS